MVQTHLEGVECSLHNAQDDLTQIDPPTAQLCIPQPHRTALAVCEANKHPGINQLLIYHHHHHQ
jgi:hypothetical protein